MLPGEIVSLTRQQQQNSILLLIAVYLLVLNLPAHASDATPSLPDLETIVTRMEQALAANHAQLQPYVVTRDYKFFASDPQKPTANVVAEIEFQPPSTKTFKIENSRGGGPGERIVRKVLEHETSTAKDNTSAQLSRRNYDFKLARAEQQNGYQCFVLEVTPKRKETYLIRGQIWVDAGTYLVHHIDGELAKSPSFWIKDIHVTLDFSGVSGMWLQTQTLAVANIRFLGTRGMAAHDVNCQTTLHTAAAKTAQLHLKTPFTRNARKSRPLSGLADAVQP